MAVSKDSFMCSSFIVPVAAATGGFTGNCWYWVGNVGYGGKEVVLVGGYGKLG